MSLLLDFSPSLDIMVGVGILTTSTSLILRLVARRKQRLSFGVDDYLAVLAWFVFLGVNAVSIFVLIFQETTIDIFGIKELYGVLFGAALGNIVALGCGRLSAVFFYRRIFYTVKQDIFDIVTKIMIGILLLWTVCFFLSTLLACGTHIDLAMSGDFAAESTHGVICIVQDNQNGLAISSFLLDFLVLILPLPKIWALHTPRARKIAISSVFLIALISLTASGLRVTVVFQMEHAYGVAVEFPVDSYLISVESYFYQLLETAACLTAINMPSIWYFSHHLRAERLRRVVGVVFSFSSTKLWGSAEKSNAEFLKNESIEFSDSEAIPTRRAHLELESSHTFNQDESAGENDHRV